MRRAGVWVGIVAMIAGLAAVLRPTTLPTREFQFVPGAIGTETASSPRPLQLAGNEFRTRAFSGLNGPEERDWGRRNGLTASLALSHHLAVVFPPSLAKARPEFFPLEAGRRLQPPEKGPYFWNPDIAREDAAAFAAEAARRHFAAHPGDESFALGVNDALVWGESPELLQLALPQKWFRERPDYSNVVFTFMNRAATHLSRTHPDKYLGALAYYWAEQVPDFSLHPQVVPFLTADRSQGYDAEFWREEMELQARWGALARSIPETGNRKPETGVREIGYRRPGTGNGSGETGRGDPGVEPETRNAKRGTAAMPPLRRLGIYDYVYGGGFLIPRIHPRMLAEHLRHARRAGFTDYYAEVNPNWGLDGPQPWLLAQLLQDPEQSAPELLDTYYRSYFRESAEPMRRFFARCEEQWMRQPGPAYWLKHYRNESQAIVFPSGVCGELQALLDDALRRAATPRVRVRVQFVSDAFGVTRRFIALYEQRNALIRAALARSPDREVIARLLGATLAARRDFIRYTWQLRQAQPLALHPFGWDDYLRNDPVPLALFAMMQRESQSGVEAPRPQHDSESELAPGLQAEPLVAQLWSSIRNLPADSRTGVEVLRNAAMTGERRPPRMIAGLTYGVALPVEWTSRVEPAQFHRAEVIDADGARVLRISGTKDTTVSQWVQATQPGLHLATIDVRGRVSPGTIVSLVFAWLDVQHRHVGFRALRLPDGEWPDWVTLRQAGMRPRGAAWVGLGIRVQNQVRGDWIEAREFSLRAHP